MRRRAFLVALANIPAIARAQPPPPIGDWRTFDDQTGRERGLVRLFERNGLLYGTILSTIDPADAAHRCERCDGARRDQPVIGLTIITDMHREGDGWEGGEILDPQTGRIYRCTIQAGADGQTLTVRGFIGFTLFGRSQTWIRAR